MHRGRRDVAVHGQDRMIDELLDISFDHFIHRTLCGDFAHL
jgi:hypothetical protein